MNKIFHTLFFILPLIAGLNLHGQEKEITGEAADYVPGDIVCWNLGGAVTHIGIVVDRISDDGQRNLVVHNIGGGQVLADCLFDFRIIGHYVYQGK